MYAVTHHPSLKTQKARMSLWLIVALRSFFFTFFVFTFHQILDFGTSPYAISMGAIIGVLGASYLAFTRVKHLGFLTAAVCIYLLYSMGFYVFGLIPTGDAGVFRAYILQQHGDLILIAMAIAGGATWCFWKFRHALTLEVLLLAGMFIYLLSGARNYQFNMVKLLGSLAWDFGVSPLVMLICIGTFIFLLLSAFLFFATLPTKPGSDARQTPSLTHRATPHYLGGSILAIIALSLLYVIARQTHLYHSERISTMTRNGVGDDVKEGLSPLDFHSALGGSSEPAALVRLEGDYSENPFSPMLYLREAALSEFRETELVAADSRFNQDVSYTRPGEAYSTIKDIELRDRVPVTQSVYLLTDHKLAFGLDYPTSIVRLKAPKNSKRFKSSYRVYSVAPGFSLKELTEEAVGDPRWSEEDLQHYLVPHHDYRYRELAEKITRGAFYPIQKANAVVQWLSANTIYTLTPHHDIGPEDDPVAPYLFGDGRGYCVHIAHATVYMLRAIGIPSRIGTGYLTDLSQSRDGHILLRMSDRHAWAEVNIQGRGWVPFDAQPEQVESHAETPVDMNLLEELMGLLDPGEEILPESTLDGEANVREAASLYIPEVKDMAYSVGAILLIIALIKLYLLYAWLLPGNPVKKLKKAYSSEAAYLHDLGYRREFGETRSEFLTRVRGLLKTEVLALTDTLNYTNYSERGGDLLSQEKVSLLYRDSRRALRQIPVWRRALGACNPSSVFSGIGGWNW